jgi:hypothetical protein
MEARIPVDAIKIVFYVRVKICVLSSVIEMLCVIHCYRNVVNDSETIRSSRWKNKYWFGEEITWI